MSNIKGMGNMKAAKKLQGNKKALTRIVYTGNVMKAPDNLKEFSPMPDWFKVSQKEETTA